MADDAAGAKDLTLFNFGRRTFLIGGAAGLALPFVDVRRAHAAPPGIPASGRLSFKVMRKGAHIGEHSLRFEQDGDNLTVRVDVRISVRVGPVPVYRYTQRVAERWRGDRFVGLESTTSSNVSQEKVTARRTGEGVRVEPSTGAAYVLPADALPLTHWNRMGYEGPLFDPKDGKALKETVVARVDDNVKLADGSSVRATRISVTGDGVMDDYYDANGVWTGLRVRVQDGSRVEYLRL